MDNSYSIEELIGFIEEIVGNATRVPFNKKSMVDADGIEDILQQMRLSLPGEINQAKKVVQDKNRIISDAKREAEDIIRRAEMRRNELLDQNDLVKEAQRRATELMSEAQAHSNAVRSSTNSYADNMLARVEELMTKDLSGLRMLRKNINSAGNIQAPPQPPTPPTPPNKS